MKTAFIFPAFVTEYLGNELTVLEELSAGFSQYLEKISRITGDNYQDFSPDNPVFIENELRSQIISYTFSCSLADTLIPRGLIPDYLSGYSMGLYAALYAGGSIDFESGVRLIEQAFLLSKQAVENTSAGMGSIIGLTTEEIISIIDEHGLNVDIANINSRHAHLLTGRLDDLKEILFLAEEEGALHTTRLLVETPYHSGLLSSTKEEFEKYIADNILLKDAKHPLVSAIDQRFFTSAEEVKKEITGNLFHPLNWQATFETMLHAGVQQFVECGAGKSLHNISRFMSGEFKVYPMNKVMQLLQSKS